MPRGIWAVFHASHQLARACPGGRHWEWLWNARRRMPCLPLRPCRSFAPPRHRQDENAAHSPHPPPPPAAKAAHAAPGLHSSPAPKRPRLDVLAFRISFTFVQKNSNVVIICSQKFDMLRIKQAGREALYSRPEKRACSAYC